MAKDLAVPQQHSTAWVVQAWVAFVLALSATTIGVLNIPETGADTWVKGYLGMGVLFTVVSTFNLGKTVRDMHEANKLVARVDEARVERILAEHHTLK